MKKLFLIVVVAIFSISSIQAQKNVAKVGSVRIFV